MTHRFNRWMLSVIILVGMLFWWLLIANQRGDTAAKPVHIVDLRQLAAIIPGQRPTAVAATVLGTRLVVGDFYAGGMGLKRRPLALVTWTLPVPGKGPIIIDPGAPSPDAGLGEFARIDHTKLSQVAAESRSASLILETQGHGSGAGPAGEAMRAPFLLGGKAGMISLASRAALAAATQPQSYTTAQALAPGVVVIPASSHAPDARLIFVQLANGREFLFTGDIATLSENWSELRLRSHLAEAWGPPQNRDETVAWLRTIRQLRSEAPQMRIVPGHDYVWVAKQLATGTISDWQLDPTAAVAPPPPRRSRTA